MMEANKNLQKPTSDELLVILEQLSFDQKRFIIARQNTGTDKAAAEAIGIRPRAVYEWRHHGVPLDRALSLIVLNGVIVALHLRRESLAKAMAVKVAGLDSEDERIRQGVATEITEAELGKAQQFLDLSNKGERFGSIPIDQRLAAGITLYEQARARAIPADNEPEGAVDSPDEGTD